MTASSDRTPPFWALLLGAWAIAALQIVLSGWANTAITLGDTDDAMRLVEVREFLAGKAWHDLHQSRVDPPHGLMSHWSRLIDAGLAGLYLLFRPFAEPAMAERLMRTAWPLLWLLPTFASAAAIAWRLGGREAAIVALLFCAVGLPGFIQFGAGRIDHHNVQIALAVAVIACAVWSGERRAAAWGAGLLSGLLLTIGFEAIAFVVLAGAAMGLRFIIAGAHARATAAYAAGLGISTLAGFLLSLPRARWSEGACDALAINTAWPVVFGAMVLLAAALRYENSSRFMRAAGVGAAGATALSMFLMIEPMCLKGPFAFVDPAFKPLWLDQVNEVQPLLKVLRETPVTGFGVLAHPLIAAAAALFLFAGAGHRREFGFLVTGIAFVLAFAMTVSMIRAHSYLAWFGLPLAAAGVTLLFERLRLNRLIPKTVIAFLLTPGLTSAGAIAATEALGHVSGAKAGAGKATCFATASYAPLAKLPAGLVAAPVDLGPHLLAHTPHTALAAPYHRLSSGMIHSFKVFSEPPEEARRILAKIGATYLVTCGGRKTDGEVAESVRKTLLGHLLAGEVPDFLEPAPETAGNALVAYRVKLK